MLKFDKLNVLDAEQRVFSIAKETNKDAPLPTTNTAEIVAEWNNVFVPSVATPVIAEMKSKLELARDLVMSVKTDSERMKDDYAEDIRRLEAIAKRNKEQGLTDAIIRIKPILDDFEFRGEKEVSGALRLLTKQELGSDFSYIAKVSDINKQNTKKGIAE